jgi:hypothetical protein
MCIDNMLLDAGVFDVDLSDYVPFQSVAYRFQLAALKY